jgi:hypothetical protein
VKVLKHYSFYKLYGRLAFTAVANLAGQTLISQRKYSTSSLVLNRSMYECTTLMFSNVPNKKKEI